MKRTIYSLVLLLTTGFTAFASASFHYSSKVSVNSKNIDTATFATGCFWCTEAKFQQLKEDYHQDYFNQNGNQPYCKYVIQPELDKFKKVFKDKLK